MNRTSLIVLAASGVLASLPASASDADIKALREELAQLKRIYEQRIEALEKRLAEAENVSSQAKAMADRVPPQAAHQSEGKANTFNPEIGLVLQGRWKTMKEIEERSISGYWPAGHDHDEDERGLSLEHTELMFAANIDPSFRGVARFAVTGDGEVEVEEASISTLGLGQGFIVRGGRFASELGYQNPQHPHEWDFSDASLMQTVLFGEEGYRQDGLQVKWVAPTDFLLQLGAEIGRGAEFPGTDRNINGAGAQAVFAKIGSDVGTSHSWQAGLSFLNTKADDREAHFEDTDPDGPNEVEGLFSGRSRTLVADFVWKWAPNGNPKERNFKFQAEAFRRTEDGTLDCASDIGGSPCAGGAALGDLDTRQTGGYAQAVYQFMPKWRLGYRYDWLGKGDKSFDADLVHAALDADNAYFSDHRPRRDSLMLDWSNSEFSRLRLQYARDRSMEDLTDDQWTLQYIMSLGAHSAHKF